MRVLWILCAVVVLFTLHCLTVPANRRAARTGELTPSAASTRQDPGKNYSVEESTELNAESAAMKVFAQQDLNSAVGSSIERIEFVGNKYLSVDMLADAVTDAGVKIGDTCDPDCNRKAAAAIEDSYQFIGYFSYSNRTRTRQVVRRSCRFVQDRRGPQRNAREDLFHGK